MGGGIPVSRWRFYMKQISAGEKLFELAKLTPALRANLAKLAGVIQTTKRSNQMEINVQTTSQTSLFS